MMPTTADTGLDHIGGQFIGPRGQRPHLRSGADAAAVRGQAGTEHIGHDTQLLLIADRTDRGRLNTDIASRSQQFRMGIADLLTTQSADADLVDEHPPGQSMIDDAAPRLGTAQRTGCETHSAKGSPTIHLQAPHGVQTESMSASSQPPEAPVTISYGSGLPDESELRLCGHVGPGTRALELGVSDQMNALAFAAAGSKAIAVDPDPARIESLRAEAAARELHVQCQVADHADLGFATSASVDLVLANRTIAAVGDLGRLMRQVHRLLKTERPFVIVIDHPFDRLVGELASGRPSEAYGARERTIEAWYTALVRSNFTVDTIHELSGYEHRTEQHRAEQHRDEQPPGVPRPVVASVTTPAAPAPNRLDVGAPDTLILRARKLGS
jgi:SAM-dependent methyltransferase